ncbi:MAG: branched-chain amino acid ABC transporter permease [Xanthobacteraceae bacterium]
MFEGYWASVAIFLGINVLMAFSLYVPMTAGLISLGQGGFMAIGAYASAMLTKAGIPFSMALAAAAALSALSGILVGIPAIRIRGVYLIILTLGFGEIVRVFFLNFSYTGGAGGIGGMLPYTNLAWVGSACVAAGLVAWRLRYVRMGRAMITVHADEVAAEAMGINLVRVKLTAFSLGAFIAGIAGAFYAHYALFIDSAQFGFLRSADTFLFVVLGGIGNPLGPIAGAAVATLVPEIFRFLQDWRMTFFGALLIASALWRPDGLIAAMRLAR